MSNPNQKRDVKLTLSALIAKKADKEAARNRSEDMYIESLGGCITIDVPIRSILYKAIDMTGDTTESQVYANMFIIYNAVSLFRNPELLEAYDIKDNVEIVDRLLTIAEIREVAERVLELAGFSKPEEVKQEQKNS